MISGKRVDRFYQQLLRRKSAIVFLCTSLVLALALGIPDVRFSADYKAYFGKNNPELRAFQEFEATYSQGDGILVVLQPPGTVFDEDHLRAIDDLTEKSWQIPHSGRVDSITNFQHIESVDDLISVLSVSETFDDPSALNIDDVREKTLAEPALVNRLISDDGRTTGIYITLALPGSDHTEHLPESVDFTRNLVKAFAEQNPAWEIALTGIGLFAVAEIEVTQHDLVVLAPLMFVIIGVLLLLCLRSLPAVLLILLIASLSMIGVLGLSGWAGYLLNPTSAIAIIVVMTLSLADSVHIVLTYQDRHRGVPLAYDNVIDSVRHNAEAISITSLTTALGFLSLNFSDSPPFHDLGNLAAAGVLLAWLLSMLLLPVAMGRWDVSSHSVVNTDLRLMEELGKFVIRRSRSLIVLMGGLAVIFIALVPRLELDDRYVEWFDQDVPFRQDTDFATNHLTGPYILEVSVDSGTSQGVSEPYFLEYLDSFESYLKEHPQVLQVHGFVQIQKNLNRAMNGGESAHYSLPSTKELAAQYLLLYELSLPFGLDLTNQIDIDKSASRVSVTLKPSSQSQIESVVRDMDEWAAQHQPANVRTSVTGTIYMFVKLAERNIRAMFWGTAIAFLLISCVLVVALRSWRLGVLSLIPNVIPILMTFGAWSILVGHVGIIASIITATTLGLVVDDTVHLLTKYTRAKEQLKLSTHDAVLHTFSHVGKALWVTTLVLVAGFLVLSFSSFRLNQEMGVMTALTLLAALIMDFLLLPAILMMIDRDEVCHCEMCQMHDESILSIGTR